MLDAHWDSKHLNFITSLDNWRLSTIAYNTICDHASLVEYNSEICQIEIPNYRSCQDFPFFWHLNVYFWIVFYRYHTVRVRCRHMKCRNHEIFPNHRSLLKIAVFSFQATYENFSVYTVFWVNTNIKTVNHVHQFDVKHLRNKQYSTWSEPKMIASGPKRAELTKNKS